MFASTPVRPRRIQPGMSRNMTLTHMFNILWATLKWAFCLTQTFEPEARNTYIVFVSFTPNFRVSLDYFMANLLIKLVSSSKVSVTLEREVVQRLQIHRFVIITFTPQAVEHYKLISKVNNKLESTPPGSLPPTPPIFHPLAPTPHIISFCVKEELCPSSFPSFKGQQARVEVRLREGIAVNIKR
ncbi:unnamed protein product [Brassica rapa]|uniref:Uncharacterized protein n=1 Tax=Brassica campestris TaxID=3711 RepID=A0A8D9LT25_BRACM|nr:unnamed protein product [Brassica rapa]